MIKLENIKFSLSGKFNPCKKENQMASKKKIVSEYVESPKLKDNTSGIFGPDGNLLLAGEVKDNILTYDNKSLRDVLKDLENIPYTISQISGRIRTDWGIFSKALKGTGRYTWGANWSPNAQPIGGCYTEWSPHISKPHFGDAVFYLKSVQVNASGGIRIVGYQNWGKLNTAAGIITSL